jgi:predicted TIM-barrel fold metal-dependent hydrolase
VICHWQGRDQWEADADEVVVSANSAAEAVAKARKQWRLTFGSQWPHLKLEQAEVLTRKVLEKYL